MIKPSVALVLLGACSFPRASADLACETTADCDLGRICTGGFCVVDEGVDAPVDSPRFDCGSWTAPEHFQPCDIPQPEGPLELAMAGLYTYDTGTAVLTDPAGGTSTPSHQTIASGTLISVDSLTIASAATLRVIGPAPLIVAAWTNIDIQGALDAGSTATELGAGANPATECAAHAPTAGSPNAGGGGGGGGGSLQGPGGNGGDGDGGQNGNGGAMTAIPSLLGGCPGAAGGNGGGGSLGGAGGAGGGAFQLTAQGAITIAGKLNAGGAGGAVGGQADNGGGGGGAGSGGMIGLEAATIALATDAVLAANGGGGGEGGDDLATSVRGADAIAAGARALGGNQNNDGGGNGGNGSGGAGANLLLGLVGGPDNGQGGGGGGGGGGAGYIRFRSPAAVTKGTNVVVSPPETPNP